MISYLFEALSSIGIFFFAVSGALFAAEKRMDILGFILVAAVTGVGGGTLRDLLLGISPVFWIREPSNIIIVNIAAVMTYLMSAQFQRRDRLILWMDAVGLALFAVLGAEAALLHQAHPLIAVVMGVMTATFGGIMRDVLCAQVLTLMRPELYISCAVLSATVYVALIQLDIVGASAALIAFVLGFGLRGMAIVFKLTLPNRYRLD